MTPRGLPDGGAQNAVNTRLLSGDLESWYDYNTELDPSKSGTINTIYLMDNQYWLHWVTSELGSGMTNVDVARGPVPGDTTERTYFTGLDTPRVTNIELATTGMGTNYPISSLILGIPAPEDEPTLVVTVDDTDDNEVTIANPGAETGTLSWTAVTGSLTAVDNGDVPGLNPPQGTHAFSFGSAASSEYYQDISAAELLEGQEITLTWQQASGANLSLAGMSIEFRTAGGSSISTISSGVIAGGVLTWGERTLSTTIPPSTAVIRIAMLATKVGGGDTDAYIDAISMSAADATVTYDGTSLSAFTVSSNVGGSRPRIVEVDAVVGNPASSISMRSDSATAYFYRNFGADGSVQIIYKQHLRKHSANWGSIVIMAQPSGTGSAILFDRANTTISLMNRTGWEGTSNGVKVSDLATGLSYASTDWLEVTVTVNSVDSNNANCILRVTNVATSAVLVDDVDFDIQVYGTTFGNTSLSTTDTAKSYVDNIVFTASAASIADDTTRLTNYVFTWVGGPEGADESAPSPVSETVTLPDGASVAVTTSTDRPDDRNVLYKRIYRAVTGSTTTEYQLVAQIDWDEATYVDTKTDDELGGILQTVDWDVPPDDMQGILALPNGIMMGFAKNQVCPSVQNYPHAYPELYRLNTDTPIVAIGAMDTSVVVATEAYPYLVIGSDPAALSMSKFEQRQGCVSKRSMTTIQGYGVVYASPDGLVAVSGAGNLSVITDQYFSRKEWQAIVPSTIVAVVHDDKYFGFYNNGSPGGFIFDPFANGNGFTWLNFGAQCGFSNPIDDKLYFVVSDIIREWEGAATKRSYTWKSKLFLMPRAANWRAAQVRAADYTSLTLRVDVDGVQIHNAAVASSTEFVLPPNSGTRVEITLSGTSRVYSVEIAEDMDELDGGS